MIREIEFKERFIYQEYVNEYMNAGEINFSPGCETNEPVLDRAEFACVYTRIILHYCVW
jgi:hypothetical protein